MAKSLDPVVSQGFVCETAVVRESIQNHVKHKTFFYRLTHTYFKAPKHPW